MTSHSEGLSTKTFGNEAHLPRVPLPTVEDSCRRFLDWCAPLLTDEQLAETEAAVDDFLRPGSPAHALHAALARYDASPGVHSWLDRFWPSRYLGRRDRIALNANYFFLFKDPEGRQTQVRRSAGLIAAALHYKVLLDDERLPPAVGKNHRPMTMVQNKFLFSTTRIPGETQDTVRAPYSDEWPGPSPFRHIVVFRRGNAFRVDVLDAGGRPLALGDLEAGLEAAIAAGETPAPTDTSVGRLTTKARAEWAQSRQRLLALDGVNAAALETIETALFCVCLDDVDPRDDLEACDHLLHGDSGSRWFDKALSFVVFADGTAGINVEHCGLDGTTILQLVDFILATPTEDHSERSRAGRSGAAAGGAPAVEPVAFVLDDGLRADVQAAGDAFAQYAADTATSTVSFPDFGSDRAKQLGISPDAFVQMAYQLAHHRSKGLIGATYEAIATRQYRHGRTEAMRVVTPEVLQFVATMDNPAADREARAVALRAAAERHVARAQECQRGEAPEQHLWELQLVQKREGASLGATGSMALYDSPGWRIMRHDYLSTSAAPSVNIRYFGFGATSPQCIGVAYVLLPDRLNLYLSTPLVEGEAMHSFAGELSKAIDELQGLLAQ
jgi:carnitine O-acetyltransferase